MARQQLRSGCGVCDLATGSGSLGALETPPKRKSRSAKEFSLPADYYLPGVASFALRGRAYVKSIACHRRHLLATCSRTHTISRPGQWRSRIRSFPSRPWPRQGEHLTREVLLLTGFLYLVTWLLIAVPQNATPDQLTSCGPDVQRCADTLFVIIMLTQSPPPHPPPRADAPSRSALFLPLLHSHCHSLVHASLMLSQPQRPRITKCPPPHHTTPPFFS